MTPEPPRTLPGRFPSFFWAVSDPVALGWLIAWRGPGETSRGSLPLRAVLAGKRLELLKETVPKLSRVAVLWDPQNPGSAQAWKESQLPARELGLQLHSMEVSSADKFESAFKEATKARSAALAVTRSALSLPIKNRSWNWRQKIDCRRYTIGRNLSIAAA